MGGRVGRLVQVDEAGADVVGDVPAQRGAAVRQRREVVGAHVQPVKVLEEQGPLGLDGGGERGTSFSNVALCSGERGILHVVIPEA